MSSQLCRNAVRASIRSPAQCALARSFRRCESTYVFQEGDTAILQKKKHVPSDFVLPIHTSQLRRGSNTGTARGKILHDDILGQPARAIVKDVKDRSIHNEYRVLRPTLGEYTNYTKRLVTPLYPHDANLIVSLLDINPAPPRETDNLDEKYEIFEAGTGHGALTLHLARAIQAYNPAPPAIPKILSPTTIDGIPVPPSNPAPVSIPPGVDGVFLEEALQKAEARVKRETKEMEDYQTYKTQRRAVLNTLDIDPRYQQHARKVVRGWRQGMYAHNVDFHVGGIPEYLEARLAAQVEGMKPREVEEEMKEVAEDPAPEMDAGTSSTSTPAPAGPPSTWPATPQPFLQHVILDLPNCHKMLEVVSRALKVDGLCLVFCPSITQIVACVKEMKENNLPFMIENTVEIGQLAGVGGRSWDVRAMRARAFEKKEIEEKGKKGREGEEGEEHLAVEEGAEGDVVVDGREVTPLKLSEEEGWNMIARPKSSGRIMGGGFVGVFRRLDY